MELAAGKYTVILEPAAVLDLVGFMFWDFGGMALLDQRSFLNNRIGQKIFGENITIGDDVYHPLQSGPPFDGEGMRRTRVELVKKRCRQEPGIRSRKRAADRCIRHSLHSWERFGPPGTAFRCRTRWAKPR